MSGIKPKVRRVLANVVSTKQIQGRIDPVKVDKTSETDIARHIIADTEAARQDAAAYVRGLRRVRKWTSLTPSKRIKSYRKFR